LSLKFWVLKNLYEPTGELHIWMPFVSLLLQKRLGDLSAYAASQINLANGAENFFPFSQALLNGVLLCSYL
jgi:hypothetical protein